MSCEHIFFPPYQSRQSVASFNVCFSYGCSVRGSWESFFSNAVHVGHLRILLECRFCFSTSRFGAFLMSSWVAAPIWKGLLPGRERGVTQ